MLPDARYVQDEDAAKQINVTPMTFRRWLMVGTMPHVDFGGTCYVLQADVDAFDEACQCRNQRETYAQKRAKAVAS
jgi:excisionase family DNA binding protein